MSIQPISSINISFKGNENRTDNNNSQQKSSIGKKIGFTTGLAASGLLFYSQMRALKTPQGKRNLIEGFQERGKSLNSVKERIVKRDNDGKIIPLEPGEITERTKAVIGGFKKTLALWGVGITAATTCLGKMLDSSNNSKSEKHTDSSVVAKK